MIMVPTFCVRHFVGLCMCTAMFNPHNMLMQFEDRIIYTLQVRKLRLRVT